MTAATGSGSDESTRWRARERGVRPVLALVTALVLFIGALVPAADAGQPTDGELSTVVDQIGASALWAQGVTGGGVQVAVIDTGVAPVPALLGSDKVVAMVDLSFEAGIPEAVYLDTNGHGTHMTGIIAGNDPGTGFAGVAPDAEIVSVKVGDNTGAVDVSQVIAAIDWVVQHRDADGLDIRILNLSYGTDGSQDVGLDPLTFAVERAWEAGIVVVVAAGNDGAPAKGLSNPARDPYVIAVGAAEIDETNGMARRAAFSTKGNNVRNPDIVAPGKSIESLRVPGSRIDVEHPEGYVSESTFRGSGSSQAAAVVSGAVALLLDARPDLTPDEVKHLLTTTAAPAVGPEKFVGHGLLDIHAAASAPTPGSEADQSWPRSSGLGSLEEARGSDHVVINGTRLQGEFTVMGNAWDAAAWTGASWLGASWLGASWLDNSWTGASWLGASWLGGSWTGASWLGASWLGASWLGASWLGGSWTGASWLDNSWTGASWLGASWLGASWLGASWLGTDGW